MKISLFHLKAAFMVLSLVFCGSVLGQSDVPRQTIAVTYPLDESVTVKFRGTTLLPRLSGEAKVKRAGRRGTRVELDIDDLPRASELGGIYSTYVLWAISPDGRVDNMGEIKRSGSQFVDSKIDVTTPLQTFALIVTAEPHFLMKVPSRMVVLENLPPQRPGNSQIATVNVQYIGNSSDYFRNVRVPEIADRDYRETPVSLLGARQAVSLAKFAGAAQDAPSELQSAEDELQAAEKAWRLNEPAAEVDVLARKATSSGARAEEVAAVRKAARLRREEIQERDEALRTAEKTADEAQREITQLRASLDREQRARELAERDAATANEQVREQRIEIARLRDELQTVRTEGESAKLRLARIEGERQAEESRRLAAEAEQQRRVGEANLKQGLAKFGSVKQTSNGFQLILPESIWSNARESKLKTAAAAKLEPLAALLASNPDYQITIETYTDNRGDEVSLQQLTQERARLLSEAFQAAGVEPSRIQANGMGASNPVSSNASVSGRTRNRRTEITLTPNTRSTASSQ
ncbi:MAG TPA: OmpA family protein [Pyrinomonadaceae bacterium]|jgi:outer membrane protein OmpA-like peptidoglycan-associated protein